MKSQDGPDELFIFLSARYVCALVAKPRKINSFFPLPVTYIKNHPLPNTLKVYTTAGWVLHLVQQFLPPKYTSSFYKANHVPVCRGGWMPPPSLFPSKCPHVREKILLNSNLIKRLVPSKTHEPGTGPPQTPLPSFPSLPNADLTFQRWHFSKSPEVMQPGTVEWKFNQNNKKLLLIFLELCRQLTKSGVWDWWINTIPKHHPECSEFIFIPSSFQVGWEQQGNGNGTEKAHRVGSWKGLSHTSIRLTAKKVLKWKSNSPWGLQFMTSLSLPSEATHMAILPMLSSTSVA